MTFCHSLFYILFPKPSHFMKKSTFITLIVALMSMLASLATAQSRDLFLITQEQFNKLPAEKLHGVTFVIVAPEYAKILANEASGTFYRNGIQNDKFSDSPAWLKLPKDEIDNFLFLTGEHYPNEAFFSICYSFETMKFGLSYKDTYSLFFGSNGNSADFKVEISDDDIATMKINSHSYSSGYKGNENWEDLVLNYNNDSSYDWFEFYGSQPNIKLYAVDCFMFEFKDIVAPVNDGKVTVKYDASLYTHIPEANRPKIGYIFNDGETPTPEQYRSAETITLSADNMAELTVTEGKNHLWAFATQIANDLNSTVYPACMFHGYLDGTVTAEGTDYVIPTEKQESGNIVDFKRSEKTYIYYTLDGSDPVLPSQPAMTEAPSREAAESDIPAGTLDYDTTPLKYEGAGMSVKFIAYKPGKKPSEVRNFSIDSEGMTTSLVSVEADSSAPVFYNLQGQKVAGCPTAPGIYIRRQGNVTAKIAVR